MAVIACGERWPGGGLRPSLEDQIGAGAVLACLDGAPSPEVRYTEDAFRPLTDDEIKAWGLVTSCMPDTCTFQDTRECARNAFSTFAWKSCTACSLKWGRSAVAMRRPWV